MVELSVDTGTVSGGGGCSPAPLFASAVFPCTSGCYQRMRFEHRVYHHETRTAQRLFEWLRYTDVSAVSPPAPDVAFGAVCALATQFAVTHTLFAAESDRFWSKLAGERLELPGAQTGGAFQLYRNLWVVPEYDHFLDDEELMQSFSHDGIDTKTGAVLRAIGEGEPDQ